MVDPVGCVVSGGDAAERAAAMTAAGAACELREAASTDLRLPVVGPVAGPVLVDPSGGVVDVDAVRALLVGIAGHTVVHEQVDGLDGTAVRAGGATHRFDAVVLAAGADTAALAAQVGVDLPSTLEHHARFTFRSRIRPRRRDGPRGSTARPRGCALTSTAAGRGAGRSAEPSTRRRWRGTSGRRRRPRPRGRRCSSTPGSDWRWLRGSSRPCTARTPGHRRRDHVRAQRIGAGGVGGEPA